MHVIPRRYAQDERNRVGEGGKDRKRERQKQNRDGWTTIETKEGIKERGSRRIKLFVCSYHLTVSSSSR